MGPRRESFGSLGCAFGVGGGMAQWPQANHEKEIEINKLLERIVNTNFENTTSYMMILFCYEDKKGIFLTILRHARRKKM